MKVSEYLREYQSTKQLPEVGEDSMLHYWAGWLIGRAAPYTGSDYLSRPEHIQIAIEAAHFIEEHAK